MAETSMPRFRLFALLVLALAAVSLVPLLLSDLVLIGRNRDSLETMEKKYTARSAEGLAQSISNFFRSGEDQLDTLADTMKFSWSLSGRNPFSTAAESGILPEFVKGRSSFLAIRLIDNEGHGAAIGPPTLPAEIEAEFRNGFLAGREGNRYFGAPERVMAFPAVVSIIAEPIFDDAGTNLGVVEGVLSWLPLTHQIEDEARQEILVTVIDRHGATLLASANVPARRAPNSLLSDFRERPARLTRAYRSGGVSLLGSIAPVSNPDWGVLVEQDQKLAFASVEEMTQQTVLWSIVALLLAILAGVAIAARLSRPIRRLAEKAHEISEGHYGEQVEVSGSAEIRDLSVSFNRMSSSIETAMEDLKRKARENHDLFLSSVRALAAAIDAKDPYTRGHSERVARYSVSIGRAMELSPDDIRKVRLAALLHDVGKIGIDDRILRKPTALTEDEFEIMKLHPEIGASIMSTIPQLADVIPGMRHHHERWAGGGYPDNLKGEEIPLLARVVAVADTFDAMTTTRPYQRAMETSYVIRAIEGFAGTRFDPRVTAVLIRAYESGELVPPPPAEIPVHTVA